MGARMVAASKWPFGGSLHHPVRLSAAKMRKSFRALPYRETPLIKGSAVAPEDINRAIGRRLADRRRQLGLSLSQVSARCGVTLQQVHKYEIGETPMSAPMLLQMSRCLDTTVSYFFATLESSN